MVRKLCLFVGYHQFKKKNVNSLLQALYTLYLDALFVFIKWYRNYSLNIQPLQKKQSTINL